MYFDYENYENRNLNDYSIDKMDINNESNSLWRNDATFIECYTIDNKLQGDILLICYL